jgi:2-polyprenyl-3-methyl-5-hydroxy-6-metoxy-1,4-benzoquinol methylase
MQLYELNLTKREQDEIERLMRHNRISSVTLEELWKMMDQVWDELGCDNKCPTDEQLSAFYQHPIWVLNGLFIEQDKTSIMHREWLLDWIVQHQIIEIVDYGGGFGTLPRMIASKDKQIQVDIYEPFPSELAISKVKEFSNARFINSLEQQYQCLLCLDVLEHVTDPITLFAEMISAVRVDGYLMIANCFYPYIKCHLPSTFHFRYTFDWFAHAMGLKVIERGENTHVIVYQKIADITPQWQSIRRLERLSQIVFPLNELLSFNVRVVKLVAFSLIGRQRLKTLKGYLKSAT